MPSSTSHRRPNVVLIVVDQWRCDCLSVDDHPVVQTPYLDQLALDGVRFSRAYSASPPGSGIGRGRVADEVVELRDVMPTLLDCAGLPIPESVEGRSFLPIARGEERAWREHLHGEHTVFGQSAQWLTDGHEKYVWYSGTDLEQLFDLDPDPQELRDLARKPDQAERVARWRGRLIEELSGREEGFVEGGELIAGRPVDPVLSHLRKSSAIGQFVEGGQR